MDPRPFSPEVKPEIVFVFELVRDVTAGKLQPYSELLSGKAAMLIEGSWILRYVSNTKDNPRDFSIAFAPMPHFKDTPNAFRPGNADDRVSIAKNSKNKEAAWKFIQWVQSRLTGTRRMENRIQIVWVFTIDHAFLMQRL